MEVSVFYNIKRYNDLMSAKEKKIANFILENPSEVIDLSISDLSNQIGISTATMVRFVRKIGFDSYHDFRISLAKENIPVDMQAIESGSDPISLVFESTKRCLDIARNRLSAKSVSEAGDLIIKASMLYAFGVGGSAITAFDFFHRFISTGIPCVFNTDFHTQLILASQSKPKDVAVLFCYTGINRDSIDIAKVLKEKGCTLIIITRDDNSPINQYADLGLYVSGMTAPSEITDTYPERISLSVVVDVLYLVVISKLKDKSIQPVKNVVEIEKTRRL